jgi:hypothetical protein
MSIGRALMNYMTVVAVTAAFLDLGLYISGIESNFFGLFFIIVSLRGMYIALTGKT